MTAEQIRAEAIEVLARKLFEDDEPGDEPFDDWAARYRRKAAPFVDALAAAGLLPVGVDYRWAYQPDGTPLGYRERQLLTEWRDGAIPCSGCGATERECGRFHVGVKCCPDCRHRFREVSG